ncbi:hypothetical protein LJR118_003924 [Acidovorax sp. LjRoot118]|uniref:hypothetical protein n=1 Tax=Acidovorax sp. LjRoot118 TaxID=3342256 RepID=UPI003ECEE4F9
MALCITLQATLSGGPGAAISTSGYTLLPWVMGEATKTGDQYACPSGTHLLMTIAEVNTPPEFVLDLPALGITPEHILFVAGMGAALVLSSYLSGWGVGLAKDLIKKI